jgi:hypothetical protein
MHTLYALPVPSFLTLSFCLHLAKRTSYEAPHWISDTIFVWSSLDIYTAVSFVALLVTWYYNRLLPLLKQFFLIPHEWNIIICIISFNAFKHEVHLNVIKWEAGFLAHKKTHCPSITKTNRFILLREIIAD